MSNPGERNFQGSKTSSQSRHMYILNKEKNKCQSFIYGPQYTKMCIFLALRGALGGP